MIGDPKTAPRRIARFVLLPLLRPRRIDVCCCGLSKTGTHSMAGIFENYRSVHHPDQDLRLPLAIARLTGELDLRAARRTLWRRDRSLWLEMESSSLGGILIEPLAKACPRKRFILTVRDPLSWCDSWIDHQINRPPDLTSLWGTLDRVRLRADAFAPTRFDAPLTDRGYLPLPCYFQLWTAHNEAVLAAVEPSRLLIVKTDEIAKRLPEIATWAGIPADSLRSDRSWLFAAPQKHGVLADIDPGYLRDTVEAHCGALMRRFSLAPAAGTG
jgi:hypothetical protein